MFNDLIFSERTMLTFLGCIFFILVKSGYSKISLTKPF